MGAPQSSAVTHTDKRSGYQKIFMQQLYNRRYIALQRRSGWNSYWLRLQPKMGESWIYFFLLLLLGFEMSWKSLLHPPGWEEWFFQCLCSTWQEGWEQWVIYSFSSSSFIPVEQTHGIHVAVKSWIPSSAAVCQYSQFSDKILAFSSSAIKAVTSSTWWGTATSTEHHQEKNESSW